jgi:alpha-1,2-mannosyltransferase
LTGLIEYDDGVYFASAIGLVNGLVPYRDFLLLHPPGIVLILAPFAWLSLLTGEPVALAVGRVSFMILGAVNAMLVARYLRPAGRFGAITGGLVYALFWPAVFSERTVLMEGLGNVCLLLALSFATPSSPVAPNRGRLVAAGCVLGFSTAVKIWGVVPLLVVFGWLLFRWGARRAGLFLVSAIGMCVLICLPFFALATGAMWRMVVLDQLQRNQVPVGISHRLRDVLGLVVLPSEGLGVTVAAALVLVTAASILAWGIDRARLVVLLLAAFVGLLVVTPAWFFHYAGLTAAVLAVTVGAAAQRLRDLPVVTGSGFLRVAGLVVVVAGLLALAAGPLLARSGEAFPRSSFTAAVSDARCVTSDHPTALILTNRVTTNIDLGCPLVVDLGGYSHHLRTQPGDVGRSQNRAFQAFALAYLSSGNLAILARFDATNGFAPRTDNTIRSWPLVIDFDKYALRAPPRA